MIKFNNDDTLNELLSISDELNNIKDIDSLLDSILYETRRLTNADAGSIFLLENNKLHFGYVQNDTLMKRDQTNNKQIYSKFSLPINDKSIAGYAAFHKESLKIDDLYNLDKDLPYSFNKDFDKLASYKTISMMVIPLITNRSTVIGVMQIINAQDKSGNIIPFTFEDEKYINFFATSATSAIEKAKMTREIILRMIKMAELRDPKETGAHVNRVGSYAIEIYQKWAQKKGKSQQDIKRYKDNLRIAAMLHDVGKVAISDLILKKPGKLTNDQFKIIKTHSYQGAKLFKGDVSDLDSLSYEVAYTHHEKWSGKGYPRGLKGKEIPLAGRIVGLADVYDALVSARCYKSSWSEEDVLNLLQQESGEHFDPELVDIFISIHDIIKAIRQKFPD